MSAGCRPDAVADLDDEADSDDDDAAPDDADADAGLTGMELIRRELGGQVIGEIDDSRGPGRSSSR